MIECSWVSENLTTFRSRVPEISVDIRGYCGSAYGGHADRFNSSGIVQRLLRLQAATD